VNTLSHSYQFIRPYAINLSRKIANKQMLSPPLCQQIWISKQTLDRCRWQLSRHLFLGTVAMEVLLSQCERFWTVLLQKYTFHHGIIKYLYLQCFCGTVSLDSKLQPVNCRSRHVLLFECLEHVTFDVIIRPRAQFKKSHWTEVRLSSRAYQSVSSIPSVSPSKPKFSHSPIRSSVTGELPDKQNKITNAWNVISRSKLTV
jgi:hypothetical protein